MKIQDLVNIIGADFYTGIPDSQLKALCDYLINIYGIDSRHHIIAANEGNATAIAAGYHLATGNFPVVYMQNSGEGNIINPLASLMNEKVCAIPCIFIIGWRGEPGVYDEPQHIYQGEVTEKLLDIMGIEYYIVSNLSSNEEISSVMERFRVQLRCGRCVAFVIRKGALNYDGVAKYMNNNQLIREEIIKYVTRISGKDLVISTTGKASRELFEIREDYGESHCTDFLTVGSMGHCSSIALGVALNTSRKVWCIDGDGAVLMHLGALPVIAYHHPKNLIHIVINNGSHETVGGQPTVAGELKMSDIARDCGYPYCCTVVEEKALCNELVMARERKDLAFIEVKSSIGAKINLGRPTISPIANKKNFMRYLNNKEQ